MKKTLIIFSVAAIPFSGCVKERVVLLKATECIIPRTLIIMHGESNPGGRVPNKDTMPGDSYVRYNTKILSNTNYTFSLLQIGVNNLGACATCHGWELGLANNVDSGKFIPPVYTAKIAVGGTKIKDWDSSTVIFKRLLRITDSAISKVKKAEGIKPNIALWYSIGINDWLNKTNPDTFKVRVKLLFSLLRSRYGDFPILFTKLPVAYATLNPTILEICNEIQDCYPIETSGLPMQDPYHWNYGSMKIIADRKVSKMKEIGEFN